MNARHRLSGASVPAVLALLLLFGCGESTEAPTATTTPAANDQRAPVAPVTEKPSEPEAAAEPVAEVAPVATPSPVAGTVPALRLDFSEQLGEGASAMLRMTVTDRHLRIDGGLVGDDGYVLYDRLARTVYEVSDSTQTVAVIEAEGADVAAPMPLELEARARPDPEASKAAGNARVLVDYLANDRLCYSAVVVEGLLEPARQAEMEYLEALAAQQRSRVDELPEGLLDPCDLSRYAFAPARHLEAGYPVQILDSAGYRRSLIGFDTAWEADASRFELPVGYTRVEANAPR